MHRETLCPCPEAHSTPGGTSEPVLVPSEASRAGVVIPVHPLIGQKMVGTTRTGESFTIWDEILAIEISLP